MRKNSHTRTIRPPSAAGQLQTGREPKPTGCDPWASARAPPHLELSPPFSTLYSIEQDNRSSARAAGQRTTGHGHATEILSAVRERNLRDGRIAGAAGGWRRRPAGRWRGSAPPAPRTDQPHTENLQRPAALADRPGF